MTAVLLRARAELKARWRAWLSLTLMLGLFGGAVIAIAAGARRTDTAYPRFLRWSHAVDVYVPRFIGTGEGPFADVQLGDVEALPQVEESGSLRIFESIGDLSANAPADARVYVSLDRPKVLEGRLPRSNAPSEVAVNWL